MSQITKITSKKNINFKNNVPDTYSGNDILKDDDDYIWLLGRADDVLKHQKNTSGSVILKKEKKLSGFTISKTNNTNEKVLELGSLESIFPCSRSKILDFLCVFDEYDYSISDIARYSGISFKTALNEVRILDSEGIIIHTRTAGKAIMYKLNPDSKTAKSINKLALDIAVKHVKENHN